LSFISSTFTPPERNYEIHDQELLAMVKGRFDLQILQQSAKKEKLPYSIMLIPDTLSRRSKVDIEDDNKDQTLLPTLMFVNELVIEEDL
jgi:hypothetical protein